MQISRHWRLNSQRYRLEGYRNRNGEVSLQARPTSNPTSEVTATQEVEHVSEKAVAAVA
jgi:hypothetical protein